MDINQQILSDITVFMKYAKYLPSKKRRETWTELVDRNKQMHISKFPQLVEEIEQAYKFVYDKKVLPSMRSLQFAGKPIEINPTRQYNCCALPVDDYRAFSEIMFLLLGGTGVGFSVQKHHVEKLPEIRKPRKDRQRRFLVSDSIEGWADAINVLMKSYFFGGSTIKFDFSDIRPKGSRLITSGGKAPGPQPLKECILKIQGILDNKSDGEQLSTIEVHDIACHLADAVLAGGIRRAALISLFSADDDEMISCKSGNWWELNPQRGRANNSAVLLRHKITKDVFDDLWKRIELSNAGEPGIYFSHDKEWLVNPCCFAGNTPLLTENGFKPIKDLVGNCRLVNKNGEVVDGKVWSNGIKSTVRVKLSNGNEIICTPDHKFMLSDGHTETAENLKGKRIMPFILNNYINDEFVKYGFIQGDGGLGRLASDVHKGLEVNIGKYDFDISDLFNIEYNPKKRTYYINGYNEVLKELGFDSNPLPNRKFPSTFDSWSDQQKLSFLKGLFSANGSVITNSRISFKCTNYDLILKLADTLEYFGINSYITTNKPKTVTFSNGDYLCKESYDLNISQYESIKLFAKLISFVHEYKQERLNALLVNRSPVVRLVEPFSNIEVFDFSLNDETHWGVVGNGQIAHNCEIALRPFQMCNLTEVNVSNVESQEDLNERVKAASFIGTLQASYTDFHYLRPIWKKTTEKDALIGVSMTGIASNVVTKLNLEEAANQVVTENKRVAKMIGINSAARTTCIKPAGSTSLSLGTSSGIHAWHDDYYIRRIRVGKNEAIYTYLMINHPELIEDEYFRPHDTAVISIPQKAPEGSITRNENVFDLLERVKRFSVEWIRPGHNNGQNMHNVSATISIKPEEWDSVGNWMWENRDYYSGLSVLPYDNGSYIQSPFESIDEETYHNLMSNLTGIDLRNVFESDDNTDLQGELACSNGSCEIK